MRHELKVRVYYEDTDFSGRVYHASYLRFMERGRTEWLRANGLENASLAAETGLTFAVRSLQIEYLTPAVMDDVVAVMTRVCSLRGAIVEFEQIITRGETILTRSSVQVVTLRGARPVRPPRSLSVRHERA
jgi:acyl-CoA thioester hydrolase